MEFSQGGEAGDTPVYKLNRGRGVRYAVKELNKVTCQILCFINVYRGHVVVKFYPSFKFYFPLFQTHYGHTIPYPKTKENNI